MQEPILQKFVERLGRFAHMVDDELDVCLNDGEWSAEITPPIDEEMMGVYTVVVYQSGMARKKELVKESGLETWINRFQLWIRNSRVDLTSC